MLYLSDNDQADVARAFNSTARYPDDLLNDYSTYFITHGGSDIKH